MKIRNAAFTLIELLVVIAIIAVLGALLVPALAKAKQSGQRIKCVSQLKQWGIAMQLYLQESEEGYIPRENVVSGQNTWQMAAETTNNDVWYNCLAEEMKVRPVSDYVSVLNDPLQFYQPQSLFHCPAVRFTQNPENYPQFSFAMNSKLLTGDTPKLRSSDILDPVRTPYFVECGVPGEKRGYWKQSVYNGQPHAFASRFSWRHNGSGTIAFADAHTEVLKGEKVVDCNDASPNAGRAIFPFQTIVWSADAKTNPN